MDNLKQFLVKSVSDYVILDVDKALFNTIPSSQKADLEKYQINKIFLLIGLVVALGASIYLFYLAKSANVETLKSGLSESTRVYDESGKEVGKLFGQKGLLWNWIIFLLIFKMRLFQLKIAGFINIKGIPSKGLPVRLLEN